ncbi:hypothetical protein CEXT_560621 [Caerostris extrusa]|uniref:Uncharacterized protein n=1 Tax=Caerostris extrusa TaxID=172846 RepID=A0AAV4MF90_CAEEX|nr:hypothetical protein CEXT_560621 [Caerostris extrusa]
MPQTKGWKRIEKEKEENKKKRKNRTKAAARQRCHKQSFGIKGTEPSTHFDWPPGAVLSIGVGRKSRKGERVGWSGGENSRVHTTEIHERVMRGKRIPDSTKFLKYQNTQTAKTRRSLSINARLPKNDELLISCTTSPPPSRRRPISALRNDCLEWEEKRECGRAKRRRF